MIVERPERIHASILGASTAYVRLGGHHSGAKNAPHPSNRQPGAPPFKIRRTGRSLDITSPYVTNVHGTAWMSELRAMCNVAGENITAGEKELDRSATPTEPEKRKLHEGDLYLSSESLNAFQGALGGVADAVDTVFSPGTETQRAFVAIRPPGHHCSADHPSGFCWLNNVHVGVEYAAQMYGLTHAVILDFDLHHGDGSQAITWERNRQNNEKRLTAKPNSKLKLSPDIGYYSLHDINSYPCEMGDDEKVQAASLCIDNAHGQSIWNVHLQPWKTEHEFWQLYDSQYRIILDKARKSLRHHTSRLRADGRVTAKSAVFISAGFDASEWEGAGMQRHKVNVPTEFYARFTRDAVQLAQEEGTGCDGRVVSVLEGGYSDRALCSGVLSHLSGLCATPIETAVQTERSVTVELDQMMRGLGISATKTTSSLHYDKSWWSDANLTALELKVNPPPPAQAKKMRLGPQKTYATPTESFAYKVVDTDKFARSISGTMREVARPARPPTPPPPEVDWVIATQELSKLLIPTDRQTKSCTPEELAGVRTKKERQSAMPIMMTEESNKPRQLRDRKAKAPGYPESTHSDELESLRSVSRSSRRQTIAELPSASDPVDQPYQRRASRRLSTASTLSSLAGDLDQPVPRVPPLPTNITTAAKMKPPPAPAVGMQVNKTRLPGPGRPKKPATSSAPVSPLRSNKPAVAVSKQPNGNASATAPSASNDMDALTSGMKKVTLKVGSKEEHDRKQKEKIDAERRARALKGAETRKANAAAKKAAQLTAPPPSIKPGLQQLPPVAKENTAPTSSVDTGPAAQSALLGHVNPGSTAGQTTQALGPISSGAPGQAQLPPANGLPANLGFEMPQQQSITSAAASNVDRLLPYQSYGQPQPPGSFYQPVAPVPDSANGQLMQENGWANGTLHHGTGSASSPIRPSSRGQMPLWNSANPIRFTPSGSYAPIPSDEFGNGVSSSTDHTDDSTLVEPSTGVKGSSVWDVPVTPKR